MAIIKLPPSGLARQKAVAPYIFLAPFLIGFGVFVVYPVIRSFMLSFYDAPGLGSPHFIGLSNYRSLLSDHRFWRAVLNTVYFAGGTLVIQLPLALLLALVLNSPRVRARGLYRLAFFLPYVTPAVVVAFMFTLMFNTKYGVINAVLGAVGLGSVSWLGSPTAAMPALIILGLWTWIGANSLYFLGGLQNISRELIESARIDGATSRQIVFRIVLPLLRPVVLFVFTLGLVGSFQLFTQPFVLTGGGPQDATLTITMYLYEKGFRDFDMGYASAVGYALVILVGIATLLQLKVIGGVRED